MAGWRCRMSVHVPLFSSRAGCPGGKWLTGNGSWSTNGSWPIESWLALDRCTARAVQVVHVTALQCPGMLPETNLLTGAAHDTAPSYFPSFFIWRVVEPQVLLSPSQMAAGSCVSPLAEQCPDLRGCFAQYLVTHSKSSLPQQRPCKSPHAPLCWTPLHASSAPNESHDPGKVIWYPIPKGCHQHACSIHYLTDSAAI